MAKQTRLPLLAGLACLGGLALTAVLALLDPAGQARDAITLQGFQALNRPRLTGLADRLAHSVDATPYVVIGVVLVVIALLRRRPRLGLAVAVVMVGSVAMSELLKPLLSQPRYYNGTIPLAPGSWPSGHATAAMSVVLCSVLVAPRRVRALVAAIGAALAVGISYSIIILSWHFPSDVLGGFLLSATWVCAAVAAVREAEVRLPGRTGVPAGPAVAGGVLAPVALVALAAGCVAIGLLARPGLVATYGAGHRSFLVGAFAIAALAWILTTGLATGLSRGSGRAPIGAHRRHWPPG